MFQFMHVAYAESVHLDAYQLKVVARVINERSPRKEMHLLLSWAMFEEAFSGMLLSAGAEGSKGKGIF